MAHIDASIPAMVQATSDNVCWPFTERPKSSRELPRMFWNNVGAGSKIRCNSIASASLEPGEHANGVDADLFDSVAAFLDEQGRKVHLRNACTNQWVVLALQLEA